MLVFHLRGLHFPAHCSFLFSFSDAHAMKHIH